MHMTLTEHNALTRVPSTQNDIEHQARKHQTLTMTPTIMQVTLNLAIQLHLVKRIMLKLTLKLNVMETVCFTFVVWAPSKKVGVKQHSWATGRTLLE